MSDRTVWVLLADARHGRLLRCSLTPDGRCQVKQVEAIEGDHSTQHQQKSSPMWKNRTITFGIERDDRREQIHRFAHSLGTWIEKHTKRHEIDRLEILSSPRLLAALRRVRTGKFPKRVEESRVQLAGLPIHALSKNPLIRRLVGLDEEHGEEKTSPRAGG